MKMSPLDIYNKEFSKSTFGYNVSQVNNFLDDVAMAYEKLLKEINALQDKNEKLQEQLANYECIEDKLQQTLESVQQAVGEQRRQAKREADNIIKKAELKAEGIINDARNKVQEEYQEFEQLKESKELFKIRFKTLLKSHLELLEENSVNNENIQKEDIIENSKPLIYEEKLDE